MITKIWRAAVAAGLATGLAASAAHAQEAGAPVYELRIYTAPEGKLTELSQTFREVTTGLFEKHGMTNVGYWLPMDPQDQRIVYLLSYPDREAREASWQAFFADPAFGGLVAREEAEGTMPTAMESVLLTPADYFPEVMDPSDALAHVFEMRTYRANEGRLDALNARFRDHTLGFFEKYGMTNVAYFEVLPGQDMSNTLIYFLAYPDADARTAAWAAFAADQEWGEVARESERDGPLLAERPGSLMLIPTDYSPLQ